ncbi:MAG: hypothetical protein IKR68_06110 [Lachnospiraceae bacterium]|nr:hypothetical protein [Lachnospiraceae bacterium]
MNSDSFEKLQNILSVAKAGAEDVAAGIRSIDLRGRKDLLNNVKASDLLAAVKLNEMVESDDRKKNRETIKTVIIVIAVLAVVAAICYALYKYFSPDYLDEYEDDMEDEFEEDFFEDEDDELDAQDSTDK